MAVVCVLACFKRAQVAMLFQFLGLFFMGFRLVLSTMQMSLLMAVF